MRALSVYVLMCCALVLASAAKPDHTLFSDWLEQQTRVAGPASTAKPTASSPAYEEANFEWGCFSATKTDNCRCIGCKDVCDGGDCASAGTCCLQTYLESTLSCCEKADHGGQGELSDLLMTVEVGTCAITTALFPSPLVNPVITSNTVSRFGTFQAVCNIHNGEQCGHPFCDSMVMSWAGSLYAADAVSKTNPGQTPGNEFCRLIPLRLGQLQEKDATTTTGAAKPAPAKAAKPAPAKAAKPAPAKAAKPAPQKAKKADAAEVEYYHHDEEPTTYYKGSALLYSGPVTVSSRKYNLKYRTGFMEYTVAWLPAIDIMSGNPVTIPADEAARYYMVRPNKYIIKLGEEGHYRAASSSGM